MNGPTDSADSAEIQSSPSSLGRILLSIGPGLIVAGSIVGSGELIVTTKTGAEAGFSLLWLILIGCVIKVFAQMNLDAMPLSAGKRRCPPSMKSPGPVGKDVVIGSFGTE